MPPLRRSKEEFHEMFDMGDSVHATTFGYIVQFIMVLPILLCLWSLLFGAPSGRKRASKTQPGQEWQSMTPDRAQAERAAYVEAKLQRFQRGQS